MHGPSYKNKNAVLVYVKNDAGGNELDSEYRYDIKTNKYI
jgi:hypothetical protein